MHTQPAQFSTPAFPTKTRLSGLLNRFSATVARLSPIALPAQDSTASHSTAQHTLVFLLWKGSDECTASAAILKSAAARAKATTA
jgi:hypothetical protein